MWQQLSPFNRLVAIVAGLGLVFASSGLGDDVDLITSGEGDPYVFILLDVSGSMNRSVPCTAQDVADGVCNRVCTTGECETPLYADDPDSRIYVAKEALFGLMEATQNVNFGFGTFDQDQLRVEWKHWWYEVVGREDGMAYTGIDLGNNFTILQPPNGATPGEKHIFGDVINDGNPTQGCRDVGNNDNHEPGRFKGCEPEHPSDLDHPWMEERVRRLPKLDQDNDTTVNYYVNAPNAMGTDQVYRVRFEPDASSSDPGADFVSVIVDVNFCGSNPSSPGDCDTDHERLTLRFAKSAEIIIWGDRPPADPDDYTTSYNFFNLRNQAISDNDDGWEPNTDTNDDDRNGYSLKYATQTDPLGAPLNVGDMIPWDWRDDRRELIMKRMAPNTIVDAAAAPDFGVAKYFEDTRTNNIMRLKTSFYDPTDNDPEAKPLIGEGSTPTGSSMEGFRDWLKDWLPVAADPTNGDKDLNCKTLNLIVVTDGQANGRTSSGQAEDQAACDAATELLDLVDNDNVEYHVRSFALALGDESAASSGLTNVLNCIADNGGSGEATDIWPRDNPGGGNGDGQNDGPGPVFARNSTELIAAFQAFLDTIGRTGKSFSAAAVEQSSSNVDEKILLSSLVPFPENQIWQGRLDAYLKPIPTTTETIDGQTVTVPDRDALCGPSDTENCRLWDAGERLLTQAPTQAQLDADDLNLGMAAGQRRVFFSADAAGVPNALLPLDIPTADADWESLTQALGICADAACAAITANRDKATETLKHLFGVKTGDDGSGTPQPYILGEIFHSTTTVIGSPSNFRYFAQDRNGYRAFFNEHRFRRRMAAFNANGDGQLHLVDAGLFEPGNPDPEDGEFNNGTGNELFAFAPRNSMPTLAEMADPTSEVKHRYTVDGNPIVADYFIDPLHNGTPSPGDREWRTVVISGQREGGSSYFAVDVTRPDTTDSDLVPQPSNTYVPSCTGNASAACGTLPFPSVLWEFNDSEDCAIALADGRCDDDSDGRSDLGFTWSTPNVGLIRVCSSSPCNLDPVTGNVEERYVAVFGGGHDPIRKTMPTQGGNFLYMVDVETGKAIYKSRLVGSAVMEPAAVDTDNDGFFDTIYIGTTQGRMYKTDIGDPRPLASTGFATRVTDPAWRPFEIFRTDGRPIYFPPSVIFVPERAQFALAFGTGDREDLWFEIPGNESLGRFYLFVDNDFDATTPGLPFTQANLRQIGLASGDAPAGTNFLLDEPSTGDINGYYFPLRDHERMITPTFSLGGVTVFSTFEPRIEQVGTALCAARGDSRIYVVFTTTGNAVAQDRFEVIDRLLSETFVDTGTGTTENDGAPGDPPGELGSCVDSERSRTILEELLTLLPRNCRFNNHVICLEATEDTTGLKLLAPVPQCTIERNWKEL